MLENECERHARVESFFYEGVRVNAQHELFMLRAKTHFYKHVFVAYGSICC